jgi:hypothetical protein
VIDADYLTGFVIPASFALLPPPMRSQQAAALLVSIGLHESGFQYRRQVKGPACGFWQFEEPGVRGVLQHPASAQAAREAAQALGYPGRTSTELHAALADNDVLACLVARLLLWTSSAALPPSTEPGQAFRVYLDCWRPGAYTRGTAQARAELEQRFAGHFAHAWITVRGGQNPPALPRTPSPSRV